MTMLAVLDGEVRLALRGTAEDVHAALAPLPGGYSVGPHGRDGRVAVALPHATGHERALAALSALSALSAHAAEPLLVTCTDIHGHWFGLAVWRAGSPAVGWCWTPCTPHAASGAATPDDRPPTPAPTAAREVCAAMGLPHHEPALARLLTVASPGGPGGPVDLLAGVVDLFGLPSAMGVPRSAAVLLRHGDPGPLRVAAGATGGTWLVPLEDGWHALVGDDRHDVLHTLGLAFGVAAGGRDPVLVLWRDDRHAGQLLVGRDGYLDARVWNSGWATAITAPDGRVLAEPTGDAALLARTFGRDQHTTVLIRAALRRTGATPDAVLREFLATLALPTRCVDLLDGTRHPSAVPGATHHEKRSLRAVVADELARPPVAGPARGLAVAGLVGSVLATTVLALLALLAAITVATGGAAVDQDGTGTSDWIFLAAATLLTVAATLATTRQLRALRR
jgi:hypothetical protein